MMVLLIILGIFLLTASLFIGIFSIGAFAIGEPAFGFVLILFAGLFIGLSIFCFCQSVKPKKIYIDKPVEKIVYIDKPVNKVACKEYLPQRNAFTMTCPNCGGHTPVTGDFTKCEYCDSTIFTKNLK